MSYKQSALWLLCIAACQDKNPRKAPEPPPVKNGGPPIEHRSVGIELHRFDEPELAYPLHKELVLLEKGTGRAKVLRYAPTTGSVRYATLTKLTTRKLAGGTWGAAETMPPVKGGLVVSVGSSTTPLALRMLPAEVVGTATPAAQAYIGAQRSLADRRVTFSVDARGQLQQVAFADDPDQKRSAAEKDEVTQRLLAMLVPLPKEPVGVGATWRAVTILRQTPAIVKQTATYTLVSMNDAGWTIDAEVRRTANNQRLTAPDDPKPAVELVSLVRVLQGKLAVAPQRVLGTGTVTVTSTLHIRAHTPSGQVEEITEDTGSVALAVEP